jgi:hypothetical protein
MAPGGYANGPIIGSCHVEYDVKRVGSAWVVEYEGHDCQ